MLSDREEAQANEFAKRSQGLPLDVSMSYDFLPQDAQLFQAHGTRRFTRVMIIQWK
jgi:hypothetical protein